MDNTDQGGAGGPIAGFGFRGRKFISQSVGPMMVTVVAPMIVWVVVNMAVVLAAAGGGPR